MTLYKHELKMNLKSLCIWILCVGGLCFACIPLYTSLQESLTDIADAYSNMGAMSTALGMDKISLATLSGFYATEIAMMHSLGGAMFAAIIGTNILSKEEAGHTSEFIHTLPLGRRKIVISKYSALVTNILVFNVICTFFYAIGFWIMGENLEGKTFFLFHIMQCLAHLEIGSICFFISACTKKNRVGLGLGLAFLLYAVDIMCRIIPAIKNLKYSTPYYYSNGADIFTSGTVDACMILIAIAVIVVSFCMGMLIYERKDLAA